MKKLDQAHTKQKKHYNNWNWQARMTKIKNMQCADRNWPQNCAMNLEVIAPFRLFCPCLWDGEHSFLRVLSYFWKDDLSRWEMLLVSLFTPQSNIWPKQCQMIAKNGIQRAPKDISLTTSASDHGVIHTFMVMCHQFFVTFQSANTWFSDFCSFFGLSGFVYPPKVDSYAFSVFSDMYLSLLSHFPLDFQLKVL